MTAGGPGGTHAPGHQSGRGLLSTMRSLLVLGQLMTESTGERQILDLAVTAVPSLARCRVIGIEAAGSPYPSSVPGCVVP